MHTMKIPFAAAMLTALLSSFAGAASSDAVFNATIDGINESVAKLVDERHAACAHP